MTTDDKLQKDTIEAAQYLGQTRDLEALFVLLGKQQKAIADTPELANDPTLDPPYDSTHMGLIDDLRDLGSRIAKRWARKLHEIVCGSGGGADRNKLLEALNISEAAAIAVVTSLLLSLVSPAISAPVAVVVVRQFLIPAGETICDYWSEKLDETPI